MKNALIIKTFGRNKNNGQLQEIVLNEDCIESVEKTVIGEDTFSKINVTSGAFYIDVRYNYSAWEADALRRCTGG